MRSSSRSAKTVTPAEVFVVDASVVVAIVLEEQLPGAAGVFSRGVPLIAPDFIHLEVASALAKAAWRCDFDAARGAGVFRQVRAMFDAFTPSLDLAPQAFALAAKLRCSADDASYLALALARDTVVVTADRRFAARAAAGGLGDRVELLG